MSKENNINCKIIDNLLDKIQMQIRSVAFNNLESYLCFMHGKHCKLQNHQSQCFRLLYKVEQSWILCNQFQIPSFQTVLEI